MLKRSPLRKRSKKGRAKAAEWAKVCAMRLELCAGRCQRCGVVAHLHGHHKLPRSQGGENTSENCAMLCSNCHEEVHNFPSLAYRTGWLLRRNP
jgi:5-methylcytosine-specific restriction endonuclease McrA